MCIGSKSVVVDQALCKQAGLTAAHFKRLGFDFLELRAAGFDLPSLKAAGYDAAAFRAAGCSWADVKTAGFTAAEVKAAGCDFAAAVAAGFDLPSLQAAGYKFDCGYDALAALGVDLSNFVQVSRAPTSLHTCTRSFNLTPSRYSPPPSLTFSATAPTCT